MAENGGRVDKLDGVDKAVDKVSATIDRVADIVGVGGSREKPNEPRGERSEATGVGSRLRDKLGASEVGETLDKVSGIAGAIGSMVGVGGLGDEVGGTGDRTGDLARDAREREVGLGSGSRERAARLAGKTRDRAIRLGGGARERVGNGGKERATGLIGVRDRDKDKRLGGEDGLGHELMDSFDSMATSILTRLNTLGKHHYERSQDGNKPGVGQGEDREKPLTVETTKSDGRNQAGGELTSKPAVPPFPGYPGYYPPMPMLYPYTMMGPPLQQGSEDTER